MTPIAVQSLLDLLAGDVIDVLGSRDRTVSAVGPVDQAADASVLTFCNRPQPEAGRLLRDTRAGVIVCGEAQADVGIAGRTFIVVREPRLAFLRLVRGFFMPAPPAGVHSSAVVEASAEIHPDAYIGPLCYVGRASVGQGSVLHGGVMVHDGTRIGRRVVIHAGTVIGADGFGYQRNERGELEKFPHVGGVRIEDDVEIGANTCIDRGTLGDTVVQQGARIDNLVHIAHNVVVGRHAAVIAHAMIGGSTTIGEGAWISPSACVRDGLSIGARATIGLGALVVKDVPDGEIVMGAPARPAPEYKAQLEALRQISRREP